MLLHQTCEYSNDQCTRSTCDSTLVAPFFFFFFFFFLFLSLSPSLFLYFFLSVFLSLPLFSVSSVSHSLLFVRCSHTDIVLCRCFVGHAGIWSSDTTCITPAPTAPTSAPITSEPTASAPPPPYYLQWDKNTQSSGSFTIPRGTTVCDHSV